MNDRLARPRRLAFAAALSLCAGAALAADPPLPDPATGFLCCNMRTDGSWISDINYQENGKRVIPAGTRMKVTGYGRYRVHVELDGKRQDLGNDYSRDLDLLTFAKRYLVTEDPKGRIAGFAPEVRRAIENAQVRKGMTREQVFMAIGYPVSSENPRPGAKVLRYWLGSFSEFQLTFVDDVVTAIDGDRETLNLVVAD